MPLLLFSAGVNDSCQTQTGLYKTNDHTTFRFQLQNLDKISIITLMPLLFLMSPDHRGFHWKSCEKTDSITQSDPLDLAVKSLPLCILEHCWSSQIIKKTQEWEGGLTPPPLTTFAVSNPFPPICRISRDARAPRSATGNGKTGQGAYRVVYNVGQHCGMYSPEMKTWCLSWWALTCKDVWNSVLIMPLENEVPLVDQDGISRPTYQMHSAVMRNRVRDDLKVLVCAPVMCCHSFTRLFSWIINSHQHVLVKAFPLTGIWWTGWTGGDPVWLKTWMHP